MNISLPEALKAFVEAQVTERGYGTTSEFVRELIRKEQDRAHVRALVLDGFASDPTAVANDAFFTELRDQIARLAGA